jgi:hypothetical protein
MNLQTASHQGCRLSCSFEKDNPPSKLERERERERDQDRGHYS